MSIRDSRRGRLLVGLFILIAAAFVCFGQTPSATTKIPDLPDRVLVLDGSPVHNVGEIKLHMSNWGMFGSWPGSSNSFSFAPSGEWPAGSGIEHVFTGGLWVGALKNGVPGVSTASFQFEFRPTQDPLDIVYRSAEGAAGGNRLPWPGADDDNDGMADEEFLDGHDNDLDGQVDEDFAAISDQMFERWYTDDQPEAIQIYPQHNPLHIKVRERSYQWEDDDFDDFIGIDFEITNSGADLLQNVYVGVFFDGDVGNRNTPDYGSDDIAGFVNVPVVCTPYGAVDLQYGYIGQPGGSALAVLLLDHSTDPNGELAPPAVRWSTFNHFRGSASYEDGGDPTNDFERYELMSSRTIKRDGTSPSDYRILLCAGPFEMVPDQTIDFSVALVGMPAPTDTVNPSRAAIAYRGRWVNFDGDPGTGVEGRETPVWGPAEIAIDACRPPYDLPISIPRGAVEWINTDCEEEAFFKLVCGYDESQATLFRTGVNGNEYQVHWMLPDDENPTPVAITRFNAHRDGRAVSLEWEVWADEGIAGYEILRAAGSGPLTRLVNAIPAGRHEFRDEDVEAGARYEYQLIARGVSDWTAVSQRVGVTMPSIALALDPNAPNPFRGSTMIRFTVPERSNVELSVFDAAGRRVATIVSGERPAGTHEVAWDGTDDAGRRVSAGVYFCRLEAGKRNVTRKLSLLK